MTAAAQDDRRVVTATALFIWALAEVVTVLVAGFTAHLAWTVGDNTLAISNSVNGFALALAGWPIAAYRARNPIGWLLLGGGCLYASSAVGYTLLEHATAADSGSPVWRTVATLTDATWAPAITLCMPVALLLFPEGRLPSRRWRWVVAVALVGTAAFVFGGLVGIPGPARSRGIDGWFPLDWYGPVEAWSGAVGALGSMVVWIAALVALILRYRRAPQALRRQLSWPLLALLFVMLTFIPNPVTGGIVGLLLISLLPISITVAVFRRQLFDIQLVFSRTLLYALLTALVVAAYLALVAAFSNILETRRGTFGPSVLATIVIAAVFNPVRVYLQRLVDRAVYGAREDPVRVIEEVGARLGGVGTPTGAGLDPVLQALCEVMRVPWAAITVRGVQIAAHGTPPADLHATPLEHGGERVGDLVVGLRAGEPRLAASDTRVLALLAAPITVAVHASTLAEELRESRERVISSREEERRRLRRDLHDGLGPVLTGVVLNAEAALRLVPTDPVRSGELLAQLRDQTTYALTDIRRLVYELRPPALDSLGLVGALHEYAMVAARRADGQPLDIQLDAADDLGELPAAVEVAAYRIATEALTNVTRHSSAASAVVRVRVEDAMLHVSVHDDGVNVGGGWQPGVGLTSIRERAAELGGECEIRYDRTGGRVDVRLPLENAPVRSEVPAGGGAVA